MINNENKQTEEHFIPRHTEYIRKISEQTGRSYRELEAEWKKAERDFEFDRMRDPLKYTNLKRTTGTVAQEISRRFEKNVINPEETALDQSEEIETDIAEEEFGEDIQDDLVDETLDEFEDESIDEFGELDALLSEDTESDEFDEFSEDETDVEVIPNKSLQKQKQMERPGEDDATSPDEVNEH